MPDSTTTTSSSSTLVDGPPRTGFPDGARTDPEEQLAVYEVMEATGNGWARSIPDVCRGRWHGIECVPDADDVYHVVSLSFGSLSDDTAFPTCADNGRPYLSQSLLRLPHIRSLFFYRCFTTNPQPIPPFLGKLGPSLRTLVLRENGHVGAIPGELGNLTSLKVMDLHANSLGSSIPSSFSGLTKLELLDLSANRLQGLLPRLDHHFSSLKVLDLNRNLLEGPISQTIGSCSSLIKVDLSHNRLTGQIPDSVQSLNNLILFDLSQNRLSGPLSLSGLVSLKALVLNGNAFGTSIPENAFSGLNNLSTLVISDSGLVGPIPTSLAELPSLRVLHLDRNGLNGSIPRRFGELERLSELRLNDNHLIGPIPFKREMLWRMGRKLRISNNLGLCYDVAVGGGDGVGPSLSSLGVDYCERRRTIGVPEGVEAKATATGAPQTQHLSSSTITNGRSGFQSSPCVRLRGSVTHTFVVFLVLLVLKLF
ncbi:Protein TOO MANY MOUTHS [Acorus calamus]|uniref:Protein TOO MANY MOUTHS n=1 Tax=Acorus calamus TaxID=4465 RepID=A0AAV9CDN8_ACOCL|nr:Protein TOO MANY MOUTHS [Acorus calamus]